MINKAITLRRYTPDDERRLFSLIEQEGDEWKDYWGESGREKYKRALSTSITYLILENEKLCGYARCRDDDGYGVYIYDLLVDSAFRGREYGRMLMEQVCKDFPGEPVYVMSDVNPYYEKLGYAIEGSIFIVSPNPK